MTPYEHVMFGVSLALGANLHRRQGWRIVAVAGIAAASPDWDGLTIAFGATAYAEGHRTWGHNLLVAPVLGGTLAGVECVFNLLGRLQRAAVARFPQLLPKEAAASVIASPSVTAWVLGLWVLTGMVAALSHLPIDMVYAGHANLQTWYVKALWPFSDQGWAAPVVPWGDLGTTLIFVLEMFALYRWPKRAALVAWLTLACLLAYVGACWAALD